jgi:hypothetical protein
LEEVKFMMELSTKQIKQLDVEGLNSVLVSKSPLSSKVILITFLLVPMHYTKWLLTIEISLRDRSVAIQGLQQVLATEFTAIAPPQEETLSAMKSRKKPVRAKPPPVAGFRSSQNINTQNELYESRNLFLSKALLQLRLVK